MNCGSPGSSVHGISQARILGWFAISFPRGSFLPRGWACVFCIGRQSLYHLATREAILRYLQAPNWGLPWWLSWLSIFLRWRTPGFDPWVEKIPWRREQLPTPVFWPGEFHGLYNPWGHKEPDTTERLSLSNVTDRFFFFFHHALCFDKIPWSRERLPPPVFWPGEFHGQRNLMGYRPWGCKALDMTEQVTLFLPWLHIIYF